MIFPRALSWIPLLLLPAACGAPAGRPGPPPGQANLLALAPTFQEALLKEVLAKGCPPGTQVRTWRGPSMTDPIDGAAEEYLRLGALGLALARTPSGEEVLLFDMGTPEGAYGMFLGLKDPRAPFPAGLAPSGDALVGRKGRFLVQFPSSWNRKRAASLLALLPGDFRRPPLFRALPGEGLLAGSERILQDDPWGFGLFRWGLSGLYFDPPLTLTLLVPRKEPGRTLSSLEGFLRTMGAGIRRGKGEIGGTARGLGKFLFLAGRDKVVGLTGIPGKLPPAKVRALAEKALLSPPLPAAPPWEGNSLSPGGKRVRTTKGDEEKEGGKTLEEVEAEIGRILERFIEDPKEPLPTKDLSGSWRLQVRTSFQEVTCRKSPAGKGWDFSMKGRLGGKTMIHLDRAGNFRFKGWIRAMGGKGGFTLGTWPFSMTLSRDGSELNGKIRPPGRKGGMDLQLVRPVHVKDHERLTARLKELLALRDRLLEKEKGK